MTNISITVDDKQIRAMGKRYPDLMDQVIRGTLEDGSTKMLAEITRYPSPPPDTGYRRTNTLFRSWSRRAITKTANGWRVIVGSNSNMAPYNRWVQDRDRQAKIHQGRWVTAQDVIESLEGPIQRFADARLKAGLLTLR
jgi:hypothetical protein